MNAKYDAIPLFLKIWAPKSKKQEFPWRNGWRSELCDPCLIPECRFCLVYNNVFYCSYFFFKLIYKKKPLIAHFLVKHKYMFIYILREG